MKHLMLLLVMLFAIQEMGMASPIRFPVPVKEFTSGVLCTKEDKDFKELRYKEQIPYCNRNVSIDLKKKIYDKYLIPENERVDYTIDHFYPLSLGGNNSEKNLWAEHKLVKATRQNLEQELYDKIRRGEITQKEALEVIIEAKLKCLK